MLAVGQQDVDEAGDVRGENAWGYSMPLPVRLMSRKAGHGQYIVHAHPTRAGLEESWLQEVRVGRLGFAARTIHVDCPHTRRCRRGRFRKTMRILCWGVAYVMTLRTLDRRCLLYKLDSCIVRASEQDITGCSVPRDMQTAPQLCTPIDLPENGISTKHRNSPLAW